jgi:hypothetical protein
MSIGQRIIFAALVVFAGVTLYQYVQVEREDDPSYHQPESWRDSARVLERSLVGTIFPVVACNDALTPEHRSTGFAGWNLVILVSPSGCNDCSERELRTVDSLALRWKTKVTAVVLSAADDERNLLLLKKVTQSALPFWNCTQAEVRKFNITRKYPLVALLSGQRVVDVFLPIFSDPKYSSIRYREFEVTLGF